jgi:glycosyltransferase involved in cell wall biosynthesis
MKIVYLYSSLAIMGGVERVLVDKMNYLVSHGYEVYMITSDQGQHPVPYLLDERVHLLDLQIRFHSQYQYRGWHRIREGRRLKRLYHQRLMEKLQEFQPNVIVCTTSQDVHGLLRIKGRIPLVVESHVNFTHSDTWINVVRTLFNNYWIGKANAVVTLTQGDSDNWKHVSRHVHVIPNVVHLNNTGRYSDCTKKRAIFVGRLVEQKGLLDLVKIWRIANQQHPDWQLEIYGDGQMDSIPEMKLFVHLPIENIIEEYINSSILLMTSVYEPFGLVLPEAMSCGLPVVAFDCPYGPEDIINHERNGYLVPNRDVNLYADYVCQLMESSGLRQNMGAEGIKTAQRYQANQIMPQWQRLFSDLTSKEPFLGKR